MLDLQSNEKLILQHFGWLLSECGFKIHMITKQRFKLCSSRVAFWISLSADLPRFLHLELKPDGGADVYDLWELLAGGRRKKVEACFRTTPETFNIDQRNALMLEVVSCALSVGGSDFVKGEQSWKRDYPGQPERWNKVQVAGFVTPK